MDAPALIVLAGGIAAITLVLWYFFGPRPEVRAQATTAGVQEVKVTVKGGYSPDVIVVEKDRPVRLAFYRDETASCSEQVVFGDFGIARALPAYQTTLIEFTPRHAGEFTFTCGMNMLRGKLIVRNPGAAGENAAPPRTDARSPASA
jgi:plastocyanin domain-containing protein